MPLVVAIVFVAFAYLIVRAGRAAKARTVEIRETWRAFGHARGLEFLPSHGSFRSYEPDRLKGRIDHVDLRIDTFSETETDSNGNTTTTTYTRMRATGDRTLPLHARVYRQHFLSGLGRALGFQDVATGDPAFDATFVVKADDEALVRELLADPLRSALLAFPHAPLLQYKAGELQLNWGGHEADPGVLDAAIAIASAAFRVEETYR